MLTDPIADMLTRIRNAHLARKSEVEIPRSRLKLAIAKIFEREGWIEKVVERLETRRPRTGGDAQSFTIRLRYRANGSPAIGALRRVSTPGRRVYVGRHKLKSQYRFGVKIISTSKGIMTEREAYQQRIGGEVMCYIW